MFFNFLSGPRLTSKFAKSANIIYDKQKIFFNNAIWVSKTQNLKLILNPLKKLQNDSFEKSYLRKSDRNGVFDFY